MQEKEKEEGGEKEVEEEEEKETEESWMTKVVT